MCTAWRLSLKTCCKLVSTYLGPSMLTQYVYSRVAGSTIVCRCNQRELIKLWCQQPPKRTAGALPTCTATTKSDGYVALSLPSPLQLSKSGPWEVAERRQAPNLQTEQAFLQAAGCPQGLHLALRKLLR